MKCKKIIALITVLIFAVSCSCFFTFAEEKESVSLSDYFTMVLNDNYPQLSELVLSYVDFEQLESEGYTDFGIFAFFDSWLSFKFSKGEDFIFINNLFSVCDKYDFSVSNLKTSPKIDGQSCIYVNPSNLGFSFSTVPFYINGELTFSGMSYSEYIELYHPELVTTSAPSVMGSIGNNLISAKDNFITPIGEEFFTDNIFVVISFLLFVPFVILIILGAFKRRGRG